MKQKGFTLIELLVVISIIGLLASVVLVAVNNARIKGRDAKRTADINQISTALELYYANNNRYPITYCTGAGAAPPVNPWVSFDSPYYSPFQLCSVTNGTTDGKTMSQEMSSYMHTTGDPLNLGGDSGYLYISQTGNDYCIMIWRTPENMNDFAPNFINPARCTTWNSAGQCVLPNYNDIYIGTGVWSSGC